MSDRVRSVIALAESAAAAGCATAATDMIVENLDALLSDGDFESSAAMLAAIGDALPPEALTGALMVTRPARESLGEARVGFAERIRGILLSKGQSAELVDRTIERLR